MKLATLCAALTVALTHVSTAAAQHDMHMMHDATSTAPRPTASGQAAFAAIGEVVRLLEADSTTDWRRVNLEALRQHLIDMDEVTLHAAVTQRDVPGGATMDVTGTGRSAAAILRMLTSHARMLDLDAAYHATTQPLPNGVRFTVTARDTSDARAVAKVRGLGFAGLITEGDHHAAHHLAIARGEDPHATR